MTRKKVMLVDDSTTVLLMERLMFKEEPYDLVTAPSGEKALELAAAERPDIVFMDVHMPGLDGIETCRKLKADPATQAIPVVLVTSRMDQESIAAGMAAGAAECLAKPFNKLELMKRLRNHLG